MENPEHHAAGAAPEEGLGELQRLKALLSFTPFGLFLLDLTGTIVAVNNRGAERLGKPIEELRGTPLREYFPPDVADLRRQKGLEAIASLAPVTFEDQLEGRWYENKIYPIFDETGAISNLAVYGADITEHKNALEALRESEERFRETVELLPNAVCEYDTEGNLTYVNAYGLELLGYSLEDLENGLTIDQVFPVEEVEKFQNRFASLLGDKKIIPSEYRISCKDGTLIDVLISSSPIYKEEKIVGARSSVTPITERKQMEEKLRKSEERHKELADSLPQIIFETDESGNLIFANRNAFRLFGYTQEEFDNGLNALQMVAPEDRNRAAESMMMIMAGEKSDDLEYGALRKDGTTFPIMIHSNTIKREDKTAGLRGIIIDISDRKRMEQEKNKLESQLQQAQKMEAIGTLAGGIAHDFNNILFPMIGFVEMMMEDVPEQSPLQTGLAEVLTGAKRAAELVKQILAFSRQTEQEQKPLKIQIVLKEILKLIRASIPTTIEISHDISQDCGVVMADSTQIHQVVMNLITNAYHAMQDRGGRLEIRLEEIHPALSELRDLNLGPGAFACLSVSDTGSGIDKSLVERIFDPYFTTKETGKGTGLGLSVAHGIIKSHGGRLTVKSEPGEGTLFQVFLPVLETGLEAGETKTQEPAQKGTGNILLIDDDELVVKMEHQMLERLGYTVTSRVSSLDALEAFRANPDKFDLVITDMTMPGMTGVDLSQKLLEIKPGLSIIICTGFSEEIDEAKAESIGISGYVNKPVIQSVLARTIQQALGKHNVKTPGSGEEA